MNKLRTLLAAALLTLPVAALNAGTTADEPLGAEVNQPQQGGNCCWVFHMGRWYCMPC